MISFRLPVGVFLFSALCLLSTGLHGQDADPKYVAHTALIKRLYPTPALITLADRPETSLFPDKASAGMIVEIIEKMIVEEKHAPGSLAKRAQVAREKALARTIRVQMQNVHMLVLAQAIENNLRTGTVLPEAQWRAGAKPGTWFATTGADELGNAFGAQVVDKHPTVPKATYDRLKAVVPDGFWAPFGVPQ